MNKQPLYRYLTLAALLSFWSCSSSLKTAQRSGEMDDLYGTSATADVYVSNSSDVASVASRPSRYERRSQSSYRNANPDYVEDQQGYDTNSDEYYSDLSARKLKRGISPDPGWNESEYQAYNAGLASAYSWNRWGSFYSGMSPFLGVGYTGFNIGFGSPFYNSFYSPFGGYGAYAYSPFNSPFGYGYGGLYDPFYSSYAYGGAYSPFYSPFGYGGGYGYGYGTPIYASNPTIVGADPYRNARTYNGTASRGSGRYTSDFDNSNRSYNSGARRAAGNSTYTNSSGATVVRGSNGNYTSPRGGSSRNGGNYYYDNSRAGNSAPAYSSGSNVTGNTYYSSPRGGRSNSNGYSNSGARSGYSQPSYQQPQRTYQSPQQTYQQPSYQSQSRSYSQPSFSAPSSGGFSGGSRGGGGGGSVGGGGGRGPR
ncbi:hypothetical protein [Spirosoma sp. KUDC1026]|uniref:hypothetical protein n=1 Tax=Spirosoma sp. KUDC1026 TaxID=2745947 RepID=UPI00159BC8B9|nr:hypothetical protein [Spirosoma sp. KUDC1026]QKZ13886.1 hypothetical protein HU175_15095 [Spirosoma sp. KUDC1026]